MDVNIIIQEVSGDETTRRRKKATKGEKQKNKYKVMHIIYDLHLLCKLLYK